VIEFKNEADFIKITDRNMRRLNAIDGNAKLYAQLQTQEKARTLRLQQMHKEYARFCFKACPVCAIGQEN
jgi:hypothetical protein